MEITLALLAGFAFGALVEYGQSRLGWVIGVIGGAIAFVAAMIAYKGLDVEQGGLLAIVFGGAYLFSDIIRPLFTRRERQHRLVSG